uniref:Zinc finger, SWIM-type containing 8 n=1 Tax=Neolamprologus brichardi TaxID=32507 RepID=A0A3Q4I2P5_NEOBR
MELMFAEWEDGERFSFEDSDRFEEDSLCSFISEAESLCQNWRGWRKQSAGPNSPTCSFGESLVKLTIPAILVFAGPILAHVPYVYPQNSYADFDSLTLVSYCCRLYSCLANGSPDEFQRGEQLYRIRAVKDPLQIGFHLSATVVSTQSSQSKGAYNVAVMFDRCRITSCSCTCGAGAKWCAHVVALCLFRIHNVSFYPTAGPSASDQSTWYLDESTLSDNIKKTLHKFCGPSPVVFSDVNSMYLSSTEPPAAAEWACLLRPLRGREPEGIWNLLSIVREMFKRRDSNAAPLLEILTEQCLTYEQIISWWYSVRTSASHSSASGHTGRSNGQSEVAAHACASMCDEMVVLWRLAVLDPTMSPCRACSTLFPFEREWSDSCGRAQHSGKGSRGGATVAGSGAVVVGGAAPEGAEAVRAAAEGEAVGEDDYQAYYLSAASEEGVDRQLADNHQEEEPDIFAGIKPLEQEGRMEVRRLTEFMSLSLFSILFCAVVSPTGSRPPSRNRNNEMPGDEELGFEAAVAALGMKTTVSEAEHPLLCEGTRRVKGDLALALMITYKDDQSKLKKILDKLLDRESQTHKPQTLSSFYSSKPAAGSQRSPSKHTSSSHSGVGGATGVVSKHATSSSSASTLVASSSSSSSALTIGGEGATVPSRLALGARCGYSQRCWGSPVRQKKKHTGMASIDSSAPETTSDSSPTLSRRPMRSGWAAASWGRGQDSDSISSSSSDSLGSSSSSGSRRAGGGARAKSTDTMSRPPCPQSALRSNCADQSWRKLLHLHFHSALNRPVCSCHLLFLLCPFFVFRPSHGNRQCCPQHLGGMLGRSPDPSRGGIPRGPSIASKGPQHGSGSSRAGLELLASCSCPQS